uniref:Beta-defensin-like domain-containing protein n=1 Tax=Equus caballus TaxID=9796 RepID=A0A3Q2GUC2_HORSE
MIWEKEKQINALLFVFSELRSADLCFSTRVLFPLSCIGSRGFCFLIRCPPNWAEISRCLLPTEKCFRRGK